MWDMRSAGAFIYDGGAQKTLTIYWAAPNRLSFLLCPQTPDLAFCEARAKPFNLIPGGYGGRSERHQWAEGTLVLSERSPPSRTKLPRSERPSRAERRSNHRVRSQFDSLQFTACALNSTAFNSLRALSYFGSSSFVAMRKPGSSLVGPFGFSPGA